MTILIPLSVFAFVVFGSVGLYWALFRPSGNANARLDQLRDSEIDVPDLMRESSYVRAAEKMAEPINRMLPPKPSEMGKLAKKLMYAGFRSPNAPMIFRAIQLVAMVAFPLLAVLQGLILKNFFGVATQQSPFMWLVVGAFIGYMKPRWLLDRRIKRRQLRLRWGLADALDLMVVSVEAGLGVNQAMVRVSQELKYAHPEICEEFDLVNTEIRVGREREEALRGLADRTGVEDLRGLCAMLIQADRFGTSIARAIRIYADSLRTRRRQRAEQAAQKAAIKLLLPLALFLFPTLFIALLGPAFLQLMDKFDDMEGK